MEEEVVMTALNLADTYDAVAEQISAAKVTTMKGADLASQLAPYDQGISIAVGNIHDTAIQYDRLAEFLQNAAHQMRRLAMNRAIGEAGLRATLQNSKIPGAPMTGMGAVIDPGKED